MSLDKTSEETTVADNGTANGVKKTDPETPPGSSGRQSRSSRRSKERSPKHKSKSERGSSSKKKRKDRSVTPRRGRSRSKESDRRGSHHRSHGRDDKRRKDRGKKDKSSRRDRSRDKSSSRRHKKNRKRRDSDSSSDNDDIHSLKHSSTLSSLMQKAERPEKKRRRKNTSSSSSSSEDQHHSKASKSNGAGSGGTEQQAMFASTFMSSQLLNVMPQPPPTMNPFMPAPVPPPSQGSHQFIAPPGLPPVPPPPRPPPMPPGFQMPRPSFPLPPAPPQLPGSQILAPPLPPPPLPPVAAVPSTSAVLRQVQHLPPGANKSSRPVVLDRTPRDIENGGDWGHGSVGKYDILGQVGEGTYGQVYKAKDSKGGPVALKKVRLDNEREGFPITAVREIKILRQLNHPNVVQLLDIVTDQRSANELRTNNANFYLVFEYVDHDLTGLLDAAHNKLIPDFEPNQIALMFKQLLSGLEYCHSKKFLHRDIKCSNILVNNKGMLKIADWGLARLYHDDLKRLYTNRVITLWYRPPELLLGCEHYGPAVDIWSVGCILAEFFTKKAIFMGQNELDQLLFISKVCGSPTPEVWPDVVDMPLYTKMQLKRTEFRTLREVYNLIMPQPALDLLDHMLALDPKKRISATSALRHPWLKHLDPTKVKPLQLPMGQDCHELWSKKQKKDRRSGMAPTAQLSTMAVAVGHQLGGGPDSSINSSRPNGNDSSAAWQSLNALLISNAKRPDPTNYEKAKHCLGGFSEAACQQIIQKLASQNAIEQQNQYQKSAKETLGALLAQMFAVHPSPQRQQNYSRRPSSGFQQQPQQHRMHR